MTLTRVLVPSTALLLSFSVAFGLPAVASHPHQNESASASEPQSGAPSRPASSDEKSNTALWQLAQKMYAQNDFAQASSAAERVTGPSLKKDAQAMVSQIRAYVVALQDGATAEGRQDLSAAINAYTTAAQIKRDGPGNPAGRITRLQQQIAAGPPKDQDDQVKRALHAIQQRAKASQLMKTGDAQEASGDLEHALASFRAAKNADPSNIAAAQAVARLQSHLPSTLSSNSIIEPSPAPAIQEFYAGQYAKAEADFGALLASPGMKWQGAVSFYLGATRFYRALLEQGQLPAQAVQRPEVQAAFKQAHSLGYIPLPQFVSPALLQAWQSTF